MPARYFTPPGGTSSESAAGIVPRAEGAGRFVGATTDGRKAGAATKGATGAGGAGFSSSGAIGADGSSWPAGVGESAPLVTMVAGAACGAVVPTGAATGTFGRYGGIVFSVAALWPDGVM